MLGCLLSRSLVGIAQTTIKSLNNITYFNMASKRYAGRESQRCVQDMFKKRKMKRDKCGQIIRNKKEKKKAPTKFKSMWENPKCCLQPCPDVKPRYDDLFYKPSDKAKRHYTQTWVECPKMRIAKKKICCFKNIIPPPFKKRKSRSQKNKCPVAFHKRNQECIKIHVEPCCPVREPPSCAPTKRKSNCRKICTPYPSFSECQKPSPRYRRPNECRCLRIPSLCEIWEYWRKEMSSKQI